jgi:hypothetical protein
MCLRLDADQNASTSLTKFPRPGTLAGCAGAKEIRYKDREMSKLAPRPDARVIPIRGAREHNLKGVDPAFRHRLAGLTAATELGAIRLSLRKDMDDWS